jgi:manganese-dependent inorganic pyrophosphatase
VDVVGSTSTLVSERIEEAGLSAPPKVAGVLLAGLISDTLLLTSPTTTERDRRAVHRLSRWAFTWDSPLKGEDFQSYGEQILQAGAGLSTRDPEEIVSTDLKTYEAAGLKFAVAQVEVTNMMQLNKYLDPIRKALKNLKQLRSLDFAMLMVTDVVRGSSALISVDAPPILDDLPYPKQPNGTRFAKGVVSRKKQLLPAILGLLGS